jgi:hypothetical protein
MDRQRINYPVRAMRLPDETWEELRQLKFDKKVTWNMLMRHLVSLEHQAP